MNYLLNCINIKVLIYDNYIAYTHVSMLYIEYDFSQYNTQRVKKYLRYTRETSNGGDVNF